MVTPPKRIVTTTRLRVRLIESTGLSPFCRIARLLPVGRFRLATEASFLLPVVVELVDQLENEVAVIRV
jgi:hypothetical protein